jgi:hypothetical protein
VRYRRRSVAQKSILKLVIEMREDRDHLNSSIGLYYYISTLVQSKLSLLHGFQCVKALHILYNYVVSARLPINIQHDYVDVISAGHLSRS